MWKLFSYIVFFFCSFFFCSFAGFGQEKEISGTIKNSDEDPVPFANIIVNDTATPPEPITFGYGDGQGNFSIEIPIGITDVVINITAIGYKEKTIPVQLDAKQPLIIYLETSVTQLEEVVVEARSTTDTLNLGIDNMGLGQDETLRDILDKTGGVIVSEEGGISYQGKQINKILINGKEVFLNQNKVALDNLNYEIMENVQIINNYKDKFTIGFNRIRDPAINIETKPEFKGVLTAQLDAGYGFKNKYGLNGKGFFFSDKLNAFLISNTNNVGQKELSQKDVAASVVRHASSSLSNALFPFFIEDYQTKKNFVSNSSLTLRRQGNNSKMGLVLYHGNINTERETNYSTFIADTLIKGSNLKNTREGNFISATANYSHIISPKTVLQNVLGIVAVRNRQYSETENVIFVPDVTYHRVRTSNVPESFAIGNTLKLTRLIDDNTAFDLDLDYYYEKDWKDFGTRLVNSNDAANIFQQGLFTKQYFSALGNFKFRLKKGTFNAGISLAQNSEAGSIEYENNTNEDAELSRKVITIEIPLSLQGSIKKLDYSISVAPTLIRTKKSESRGFLKMSHRLTYNFEAQNNLILDLSRGYRFYHLNSLFDTIVRSFSHQIINPTDKTDQYSKRDEVSLSWFNSNVAQSKRIHFVYEFRREQDFLQSVLDSISNNVFYYANRVFDKRYTHTFNAGANKGFYFGSAYHRFDIGGELNYRTSNYSTIVNNLPANASSSSWGPAFNLGLRPRKSLVREMNNRLRWDYLVFNIDGDEVTTQSVITNTLTIEGNHNKIDWEFDFEYQFYNVGQDKFSVPDSNLSIKYNYSDKLSFSLVGRSLLTLFQLNNYAFVNTLSDGNTLTRISTSNNLGYLLFYTSFEF